MADTYKSMHLKLLTNICAYMEDGSKECENFIKLMTEFVPNGILFSKTTLLEKLKAMETTGDLKEGNYDKLKKIAEDSGNGLIYNLIEKEEKVIKALLATSSKDKGSVNEHNDINNFQTSNLNKLLLLIEKSVRPVLVVVILCQVRNMCNGNLHRFLNFFKNENSAVRFPQCDKTDIWQWHISLVIDILLKYCTLTGRFNRSTLLTIFKKEVENNSGMDSFLEKNKALFNQNGKMQLNDDQYKKIYPTSGDIVNIEAWDFEMLLKVLAICSTESRSQNLKQLLIREIDFNANLTFSLKTHSKCLSDLRNNGIISNDEYELLYPNETNLNVNAWDKWLLVIVIINVCPHLHQSSIKPIESLSRHWINIVSASPIDDEQYKLYWVDINKAIKKVIKNELGNDTLVHWKDSTNLIRSGHLNNIAQKNLEKMIDELKVKQKQGGEDLAKKIDELKQSIDEQKQEIKELKISQRKRDEELKQTELELKVAQEQNDIQVDELKRTITKLKQEIHELEVDYRKRDEDLKQTTNELKKAQLQSEQTIAELKQNITKLIEAQTHNDENIKQTKRNREIDESNQKKDEPIKRKRSIEEAQLPLCREHLEGTIKKSLHAKLIGRYTIACQEDKDTCFISSCAVLPDGNIVLCDRANKNIKLFDKGFNILDVFPLKKGPYDLSLSLENDTHVLVTIPNRKQIQTIEVNDRTLKKVDNKIDLGVECFKITCIKKGILVFVKKAYIKYELQLYSYNGTLSKTIRQYTIAPHEDLHSITSITKDQSTNIIISNIYSHCLTSLDLRNGMEEIVSKCIKSPRSVVSDSDYKYYVVEKGEDTVHVLSENGEYMGVLFKKSDGLNRPNILACIKNTLLLQPDFEKSEIKEYQITKDNV